jgi:hypothetical protein
VKPRIAEVREMVKILDSEHDDVHSLGEAVLVKAYDMMMAREHYVVLMSDDRLGLFVFGLFDTKNRAEKAIGTTLAQPGPRPARWKVTKVLGEPDV